MQDGRTREETKDGGRRTETGRILVVAAIGGASPEMEGEETTAAGVFLEIVETGEIDVTEIGRRAPIGGIAAREIEDSNSLAAGEKPGQRDPI